MQDITGDPVMDSIQYSSPFRTRYFAKGVMANEIFTRSAENLRRHQGIL
jgi:hypothetical protein